MSFARRFCKWHGMMPFVLNSAVCIAFSEHKHIERMLARTVTRSHILMAQNWKVNTKQPIYITKKYKKSDMGWDKTYFVLCF